MARKLDIGAKGVDIVCASYCYHYYDGDDHEFMIMRMSGLEFIE